MSDAPSAPSPAARPFKPGPYGEAGPRARATPVWLGWLVIIAVFIAANVIALPAVMIVAAIEVANGADVNTIETSPMVLGATLVVSFAALGGLAMFYAAVVERRGLASMGLVAERWGRRYGRGLAGGIVVAIVITLLAGVVAQMTGLSAEATGAFDLARLGEPALWGGLAALAALFLMQGASEEMLFRGWMLSSTAMRWSTPAAIVWNAVWFGLAHAHFIYFGGWTFGLVAMGAVTMIGLFMSSWSVREGGIVGACGFHGAFNATLVVIGVAALYASAPGESLGGVFEDVFAELTGQDVAAQDPAVIAAELAVYAVLAWIAWRGVRARLKT